MSSRSVQDDTSVQNDTVTIPSWAVYVIPISLSVVMVIVAGNCICRWMKRRKKRPVLPLVESENRQIRNNLNNDVNNGHSFENFLAISRPLSRNNASSKQNEKKRDNVISDEKAPMSELITESQKFLQERKVKDINKTRDINTPNGPFRDEQEREGIEKLVVSLIEVNNETEKSDTYTKETLKDVGKPHNRKKKKKGLAQKLAKRAVADDKLENKTKNQRESNRYSEDSSFSESDSEADNHYLYRKHADSESHNLHKSVRPGTPALHKEEHARFMTKIENLGAQMENHEESQSSDDDDFVETEINKRDGPLATSSFRGDTKVEKAYRKNRKDERQDVDTVYKPTDERNDILVDDGEEHNITPRKSNLNRSFSLTEMDNIYSKETNENESRRKRKYQSLRQPRRKTINAFSCLHNPEALPAKSILKTSKAKSVENMSARNEYTEVKPILTLQEMAPGRFSESNKQSIHMLDPVIDTKKDNQSRSPKDDFDILSSNLFPTKSHERKDTDGRHKSQHHTHGAHDGMYKLQTEPAKTHEYISNANPLLGWIVTGNENTSGTSGTIDHLTSFVQKQTYEFGEEKQQKSVGKSVLEQQEGENLQRHQEKVIKSLNPNDDADQSFLSNNEAVACIDDHKPKGFASNDQTRFTSKDVKNSTVTVSSNKPVASSSKSSNLFLANADEDGHNSEHNSKCHQDKDVCVTEEPASVIETADSNRERVNATNPVSHEQNFSDTDKQCVRVLSSSTDDLSNWTSDMNSFLTRFIETNLNNREPADQLTFAITENIPDDERIHSKPSNQLHENSRMYDDTFRNVHEISIESFTDKSEDTTTDKSKLDKTEFKVDNTSCGKMSQINNAYLDESQYTLTEHNDEIEKTMPVFYANENIKTPITNSSMDTATPYNKQGDFYNPIFYQKKRSQTPGEHSFRQSITVDEVNRMALEAMKVKRSKSMNYKENTSTVDPYSYFARSPRRSGLKSEKAPNTEGKINELVSIEQRVYTAPSMQLPATAASYRHSFTIPKTPGFANHTNKTDTIRTPFSFADENWSKIEPQDSKLTSLPSRPKTPNPSFGRPEKISPTLRSKTPTPSSTSIYRNGAVNNMVKSHSSISKSFEFNFEKKLRGNNPHISSYSTHVLDQTQRNPFVMSQSIAHRAAPRQSRSMAPLVYEFKPPSNVPTGKPLLTRRAKTPNKLQSDRMDIDTSKVSERPKSAMAGRYPFTRERTRPWSEDKDRKGGISNTTVLAEQLVSSSPGRDMEMKGYVSNTRLLAEELIPLSPGRSNFPHNAMRPSPRRPKSSVNRPGCVLQKSPLGLVKSRSPAPGPQLASPSVFVKGDSVTKKRPDSQTLTENLPLHLPDGVVDIDEFLAEDDSEVEVAFKIPDENLATLSLREESNETFIDYCEKAYRAFKNRSALS
ncbi:hypothetical protein DPMN_055325 [Dreissena polymorpha]|uniref:Uncharacterized protein n=1 Tax=Dreissena polymorpha TaxID=45954 RepID=A0A9D4HQJ8_DREPO|nr:hypothetical protein DPMN_055325 [Dreissena polymorpha]